jgi:hypothetical protein
VKVEKVTLSEIESVEEPVPPPPPSILKVSAHLIFDDSTESSFDVLNDKSIALWNTISGGGDATKPSNKVKITLLGKLDSINVKIYNGKKLAENENIKQFAGEYEFVIHDTGCEEVAVIVSQQKEVIFNETIPFHCGE